MHKILLWALLGAGLITLLEAAKMCYDAPFRSKMQARKNVGFLTGFGVLTLILFCAYIRNSWV